MIKIDAKIVNISKQYLKWSFRTIYIVTSMLDLNKVLMQNFYYNYIKNKYRDKDEMLQRHW